MSSTTEFVRAFGFGAMAGLVFFVNRGPLAFPMSGLGAMGGGGGLLFVPTNFGLGASGGFLSSRKENIIIRHKRI